MARAVVLGGSGNVGARLVHLLSQPESVYSSVTLISRRSLPQFENSPKITVKVFDDLSRLDDETFGTHDVGFMLLGAGKPSQISKDDLFQIDCAIPANFAQACKRNGVQHLSALSSLGADSTQKYSWLTKSAAGGYDLSLSLSFASPLTSTHLSGDGTSMSRAQWRMN
jgi:nucleoside-diphosphate-sugar epimerase